MNKDDYFKKADQYRVEGITHDTVPAKVEKEYHKLYEQAIKASVKKPKEEVFFHPAIVHRIKLGKVNFGLLKDLLKTDGIEYELVINGFYVSRDIINEYIENEIYNGKELARSR